MSSELVSERHGLLLPEEQSMGTTRHLHMVFFFKWLSFTAILKPHRFLNHADANCYYKPQLADESVSLSNLIFPKQPAERERNLMFGKTKHNIPPPLLVT